MMNTDQPNSLTKASAINPRMLLRGLGDLTTGLGTATLYDQIAYDVPKSVGDIDKGRALNFALNTAFGTGGGHLLRKGSHGGGISLIAAAPAKDLALRSMGTLKKYEASLGSQNKARNIALGAGIPLAALAAYGLFRGGKNKTTINMPEDKGRIKLTLPTRDPHDVETQVDIPMSYANLSNSARWGINRDIRRKLTAENKERVQSRKKPKKKDPETGTMIDLDEYREKYASVAVPEGCVERLTGLVKFAMQTGPTSTGTRPVTPSRPASFKGPAPAPLTGNSAVGGKNSALPKNFLQESRNTLYRKQNRDDAAAYKSVYKTPAGQQAQTAVNGMSDQQLNQAYKQTAPAAPQPAAPAVTPPAAPATNLNIPGMSQDEAYRTANQLGSSDPNYNALMQQAYAKDNAYLQNAPGADGVRRPTPAPAPTPAPTVPVETPVETPAPVETSNPYEQLVPDTPEVIAAAQANPANPANPASNLTEPPTTPPSDWRDVKGVMSYAESYGNPNLVDDMYTNNPQEFIRQMEAFNNDPEALKKHQANQRMSMLNSVQSLNPSNLPNNWADLPGVDEYVQKSGIPPALAESLYTQNPAGFVQALQEYHNKNFNRLG